jgi:hypothetical protein
MCVCRRHNACSPGLVASTIVEGGLGSERPVLVSGLQGLDDRCPFPTTSIAVRGGVERRRRRMRRRKMKILLLLILMMEEEEEEEEEHDEVYFYLSRCERRKPFT